MNLRRLNTRPKYSITYDFDGYKSMAGINKDAVRIKDNILRYVETKLDPTFMNYLEINKVLSILLRNDDMVGYNSIETHNKVMYIRWKCLGNGGKLSCVRLYFDKIHKK